MVTQRKIAVLVAILFIGAATFTNAQEKQRSVADIKADIAKLQAELKAAEAAVAKGNAVAGDKQTLVIYRPQFKYPDLSEQPLQTLLKTLLPEVKWTRDEHNLTVFGHKAHHDKVRNMIAQLHQQEGEIEKLGSITVSDPQKVEEWLAQYEQVMATESTRPVWDKHE